MTYNPAKPTNFFVPHAKKPDFETAYELLKSAVKYQFGWTAADRRIESLTYISNKRELTARVGEFGTVEHQYQVVAILEAPLYIVATVTKTGEPGPTILVDTKDVLAVREFAEVAAKSGPLTTAPA